MAPHDPPPPAAVHPESGHPRQAVTLRDVLNRDDLGPAGAVRFERATEFSGRVTPGALFAALPGTLTHGAAFAEEAVSRGAAVILSDRPLPGCRVPVAVVNEDARAAFGEVCHTMHGRPSERLKVVGVTGTNGKTTVTWLLRAIFRAGGEPAGLCGTIETDDGREATPSSLTTPATEDLHVWLARCAANGCGGAAVELSSHALDQNRAAGVRLAAAAVTNISRDHLDYHGDLDAVRAAKGRIADLLRPGGTLLLNGDDPGSRGLFPGSPSPLGGASPSNRAAHRRRRGVVTFGRNANARAADVRCNERGAAFALHLPGEEPRPVRTRLLGTFNVTNALAAAAAAYAAGAPVDRAIRGLTLTDAPPGRLERIDCGQPFRALVDYAHTPDGLRAVIDAVRPLCRGALRLVVGAGGDRDRGKRPAMGAAAGAADSTVFTSDNPRSEDPAAILRDISAGHPDPGRFALIEDRAEAIRAALAAAEPVDWVLICGKGHETTQEVAGRFLPFDDRAVCRDALRSLGYGG